MYLHKKEADELTREFINNLTGSISDYLKTMISLSDSDDWSFVIKSHALLELSVTQLLVAHLDSPELDSHFSRLPMSDKENGKLTVAKSLGLLTSKERKFIFWYSSLRNDLAHNIDKASFNFEEYFESLDKNQKKSVIADCIFFATDEKLSNSWNSVARTSLRAAITVAIIQIVGFATTSAIEAKSNRKLDKAAMKTTKNLLSD